MKKFLFCVFACAVCLVSCGEKIATPEFDSSLLEGYWKGWWNVDINNQNDESVNQYVYFDGNSSYEELIKPDSQTPVFLPRGLNYSVDKNELTFFGVFKCEITKLTQDELSYVQSNGNTYTFYRTTKSEWDERVKEYEEFKKELENEK